METMKIECPKCGATFDLTQVVQDDLIRKLQEQALEKANDTLSLEMEDIRQQLAEKTKELSEARGLELELRRQKRELDARLENLELEVERRLEDERRQIVKEVREKAEEESRLKIREYQKQLSDLQEELESAKRKAEQGSQQTQGEAAELDLETILKYSFPYDEIEPVGKGIRGADIHQRVRTPNGQFCGIIIWESKNAKNWNDRWISKLKEDQLAAKADVAVIVSTVLPGDVSHFACVDGTWVSGFPYAIGLATVLRETLIRVARAHRSLEGKDEKIELLYRYLSGSEFKQRVEMIVETFVTMKNELDSEKRAITKAWGQREKSIEKVISNVAGMYGDLQGIVGAALPTIETLELPEPA
jgi:hypothetical protein